MAISGFPIVSGNNCGGGTVTNRYAGEWDLSVGNTVIAEAVPDPSRSTGFLKQNDDFFGFLGDDTPNVFGSNYYDYVTANGVTTANSGIRSMCAYMPSLSPTDSAVGIMLAVHNNSNHFSDILGLFLGVTPSGNLNAVFATIQFVGANLSIVMANVDNGVLNYQSQVALTATTPPSGTPIYLDVDTTTGEVFLEILGVTYQPNANFNIVDATNSDTLTSSYAVVTTGSIFTAAFPSSYTFDLGTTQNGRLPFQSSSIEPVLPVNVADGKVYQIVGANAYVLNTNLNIGDFVEFADNLQKLIVTSKPKTIAQITQIAEDTIETALSATGDITTAINTAIEASKGKLLEEIEILASSSSQYYIDADSDVVVLKGDNSVTGVVVYLPFAQYQYQGKRLIVISYIQSPDLIIGTTSEYIYGNLPPITSVQVADVFEFVAQPHPTNGNPVWARIK